MKITWQGRGAVKVASRLGEVETLLFRVMWSGGVLRRWLSGKEECRRAVRANTLEAGVRSDDILQLFEK